MISETTQNAYIVDFIKLVVIIPPRYHQLLLQNIHYTLLHRVSHYMAVCITKPTTHFFLKRKF